MAVMGNILQKALGEVVCLKAGERFFGEGSL